MSWLSEIVCPGVVLAARRLMQTGGGRAERAEVGMQNRKGEEARWRRVTRLLFGHQWRDPLLDLVRELLSHASRRLCIFSPKDNQISSYAEETLR